MESRVVESRVVEILSLVWVFTILAILVVAVRLVSRLKIKPAAGWDDVAISATLVRLCAGPHETLVPTTMARLFHIAEDSIGFRRGLHHTHNICCVARGGEAYYRA